MQLSILSTLIICSTWLTPLKAQGAGDTLQNKPEYFRFGIATGLFVSPNFYFNDRFTSVVFGSLSHKNHLLQLGPTWSIDKNKSVNILDGIALNYAYCMTSSEKRLRLYLIYDMTFTFISEKWTRNMQIDAQSAYSVSHSSKRRWLSNQFGYGASLMLFKQLYLDQTMSVGVQFYDYNSSTKVKGNDALSSEYSTGGLFAKSRSSSFLKVGLRYMIN